MGKVKDNLLQMIESIDDDSLLQAVYDILQNRPSDKESQIWDTLTDDQKSEVIRASDNVKDSKTQTSHDEMIERNKKWLGK